LDEDVFEASFALGSPPQWRELPAERVHIAAVRRSQQIELAADGAVRQELARHLFASDCCCLLFFSQAECINRSRQLEG
jgi:hypothetical protein